jgi:hypothetical protein
VAPGIKPSPVKEKTPATGFQGKPGASTRALISSGVEFER